MANIKLKSLIIEAEDFKARSKETGKLVHFKSKDSYQAALKAGTHEDPKDKKDGSSKASAKPNSMFGGDYAKDRGVETPKYDTSGETDYFEEYEQLPDNIKNLMDKHFGSGDDEYDYKELQSIQKDFEANGWTFDFDLGGTPFELKPLPQNKQKSKEAPKADVKSIVKDLLKKGDKEFRGAYKLADVVDDFKDSVDDSDADGKELKARLDKGEDGMYVQTDETEGTVVFNDGSQYKFSHVEDGPIPVTKVGKEAPKADTPKANLPKKASQLNYKHAESLEKAINAEAGLGGYVDTDDNTDAIMFTASSGMAPTYTLYFGGNDDYGKPDEFRVSLLSTYGNDPSNIGDGSIDKTFKSGEEAAAFAIEIAKKYKKELEMDDDDTNESTKLTSMIKR